MDQLARIQLRRTKGWRMPQGAIKVDRTTIFGNPFEATRDNGILNWPLPDRAGFAIRINYHFVLDAAAAVRFYRDWLRTDYVPVPRSLSRKGEEALLEDMGARRRMILDRLPDLHVHICACWCKPGDPCHADVLLELANAAVQRGNIDQGVG